uniref:Putative secreted protein n=1 Tax=Anopheles marajoara TaxID=58244 RepID=A0A2M4C5E3_9DIPT
MTVTGHHLARLQRLPNELLHLVLARVIAQLLAQLLQPHQHLLVGETVQRTGETVHTGRERQVRIAQGRSDQMDGVRGHIATLVVTVDGEVQAHQLGELLVLVAQHLGEVGRPILLRVDRPDTLAVAVRVAVDGGRDHRQLGDQVHAVLVHVLPVLALVHTLRVRLGELALVVEGRHGAAQLRHRVQRRRHVVQHRHHVRRQRGPVSPFARQPINLCLRWHIASNQQPEQTLRQRFLTTWSLREHLLTLGDGQAAEANTLIGIQHGRFANQTLDATHTTVHHVDGNFADFRRTMLLAEVLDALLLLRDLLDQHGLQICAIRGVAHERSNRWQDILVGGICQLR